METEVKGLSDSLDMGNKITLGSTESSPEVQNLPLKIAIVSVYLPVLVPSESIQMKALFVMLVP